MNAAMQMFARTLDRARAEGRNALCEHEVYETLAAAGLALPDYVFLPSSGKLEVPESFRRGPVVVKVASPDILHKTEMGGVRFLQGETLTPAVLRGFLDEVSAKWSQGHPGRTPDMQGVLLSRRVEFDRSRLAAEIIVGMRWSRDFGFVGMIGLGGVKVELWGSRLPRGDAAALFALGPGTEETALKEISATLVHQDLAGQLRGSQKVLDVEAWRPLVRFLNDVAQSFPPVTEQAGRTAVVEMELNPVLVDTSGRLVPVDALVRLEPSRALPLPRPVDKLKHLFHPRTVAIAGPSAKNVNMGRVILRNLLRDGFTGERLFVLKPGDESIDGVRCYARPEDLPGTVDLAVLAVAAAAVPEMVEQLIASKKAESLVIIPGGMAETAGGASIQKRVEDAVQRSRSTDWRGPLVVGPNSMGVASFPAGCDTTFIPETKLPRPQGALRNVAYVSQSGAFAIARLSKNTALAARYMVTAGNQMDLTIGDYVAYLSQDPEVHVLAVYVEGFQEGDGARFVAAARKAVELGKTVVLYKAGRSPEGQGASAGHTASIAGDYRVTWHLARAAGVVVTESFEDFEGLVRLASLLAGRKVNGLRTMFMSNAGFEAVGMADNVRGEDHLLKMAALSPATHDALKASLGKYKIDTLVDIHNPLDVTPTAPDAVHVECARALLKDPGIDALVMGVVPLAPSMSTVEKSDNPQELLSYPESMALNLPKVVAETDRPLVAVVDSGALYDPLVRMLEAGRIPTFRSADRAVRLLGRYLAARLRA